MKFKGINVMVDKTEQKILDAALKLFSEKGYKGATTLDIAAKAGVNDSTLFRKFKTKQNLFDKVIVDGIKKMVEDANSGLFVDNEFKTHRDFLEIFIKNLAKLGEDHFEIINLVNREADLIPANFIGGFIYNLSEYIEKHVQNDQIDYEIFAFDIISFIYVLYLDHRGIFNREETLEKYINNLSLCIQ